MATGEHRYDRFMVHVEIGHNNKLDQLPPAQRWVYVAGILAIASKSPIRGTLLIPPARVATEKDLARQANVTRGVARKAMDAAVELGLLEPSEDAPGALHVHDWEIYNPAPRATSREGERLRKAARRARQRLEAAESRAA
jgi:hypothetical protein